MRKPRKTQRGLSLIELLLVLAVAAGLVTASFVAYENISDTMEANRVKMALDEPVRKLGEFVRRSNAANCNGDAGDAADMIAQLLGAEADEDGTGPYILTGTLDGDNRRCRSMWQDIRSIFRYTPEGTDVGDATYDSDDQQEWHIGTPSAGYDIGFALNAEGNEDGSGTVGTDDGVAMPECAHADAGTDPNDVVHVQFAVAVRNINVCEKAIGVYSDIREVEAWSCVDNPGGDLWVNAANVEGEAALFLCFNNPGV